MPRIELKCACCKEDISIVSPGRGNTKMCVFCWHEWQESPGFQDFKAGTITMEKSLEDYLATAKCGKGK